MKRQFLVLIALAAFTLGLSAMALGQTGKTLRTDVKFDFQIGDRVYPAGEYRIEPISSQSTSVLQIRSVEDVNNNQMILGHYSNVGKRQTPKLVFEKYGDRYFLTGIFFDSEPWGYSISPPRGHRESENRLASGVARNNRK